MRGLERGLERAIGPVRVECYVEIEAFAIFNLVRQMEQGLVDPRPVWTNVKTFPAQQFYGKFHGLLGGYPCQPFSLVGKLTGENHPAHLWPHIKELIRATGFIWCGFENVVNHLNIGYQQVRSDLEELGYTVKEGIYSAVEAGASHRRERLFILAVDHSCFSGHWQEYKIQARGITPFVSSEELGNTESVRKRKSTNEANPLPTTGETRNEFIYTGVNVDHSIRQGLEGYAGDGDINGGWQRKTRSASPAGFPLGPGHQQWDWEEPRTIKPGVGSTVNGYNFHTDLLRMYGNGVVEQTAEIAFIDLMKKHGL
jgi:site-specific DNA-cytosine methylase